MSADNLNGSGKIRRRKVTYNHSWYFFTKEELVQKFKKKNWHMKYFRDGFTWFNHNCIRKKKICNYSKSADKSCGGKLKVAENPDEMGIYRIEFTEDGYKHFDSELNDSYGNFAPELFEEFDNSVPKPSSSVNEITLPLEIIDNEGLVNLEVFNSNPSKIGQSQSEQEKKEWDELSKKLMECVQISPRQIPYYRYRPPEIISVSKDNDRINWEKLKANSNLKMIIARSTIGLEEDKQFYNNYKSMVSGKFQQLGVYHHFLGGSSNSPKPEEQLQFVTKILEKVEFKKQKDLFGIAVQTEHNADADPLYFTAQLARFVSLVLQNDFMRPIIYCNNNSWKKLIDSSVADELFSKLPLWIARYTDDPNPEYPDTWKSRGIQWWMWQYSDLGLVDGIINHVHVNRRNELYSIQDDLFCSAV